MWWVVVGAAFTMPTYLHLNYQVVLERRASLIEIENASIITPYGHCERGPYNLRAELTIQGHHR